MGIVGHGGTKGAILEHRFRSLLASVFPPEFVTTQGFVFDALGRVSPQVDVLVADMRQAPGIATGTDTSYVPIEAAYVLIEVKSDLKSKDKDQVQKCIDSVNSMTAIGDRTQELHAPRMFVYAFNRSMSSSKIELWLNQCNSLDGVCIGGKHYIWKGPSGVCTLKDHDFEASLVFVSSLLCRLEDMKRKPLGRRWRIYFEGVHADQQGAPAEDRLQAGDRG